MTPPNDKAGVGLTLLLGIGAVAAIMPFVAVVLVMAVNALALVA